MKCSQTGRKIKAKVGELSTKDMTPLTETDLVNGSSLIAVVDGTPYPVEFVQFTGMSFVFVWIHDSSHGYR